MSAGVTGTSAEVSKQDAADTLLEQIEQRAFAYFVIEANAENGLVRNTTEPGAPASITACGVALSAIPIGIERGWITQAEGYARALQILRTLHQLEHMHGFFYHFLDFKTGARTWHSEISCIDASIAIAGALVTASYFPGTEVERLAVALYERVEWPWLINDEGLLQWSWRPEGGFEGGSIHFSEGLLAYLLALGSPTHPISPESWQVLQRPTGRYGNRTVVFVHDGSLFEYLLPLAWVDLRQQHDAYLDYWTNARNAVLANHQFCLDQAASFLTYRKGFWGLSAALGPDGYRAYGSKPGIPVHDGTVAPYVVVAALPLVRELALETIQRMREQVGKRIWGRYGFTDALNLDRAFVCPYYIALDQGLALLMVENARTGLMWRLMARQPALQQALARAGFAPGAQAEPSRITVQRGNPGARLVIRRAPQAVSIDGDLSEWRRQEATPPIHLTPIDQRSLEFGIMTSEDDASLSAYLGWDEDHLYVAGLVHDDELVNHQQGSTIYLDDCLEVYVDHDGNGFRFDRNPLDAQVGLAPTGPAGHPQVWIWGSMNQDGSRMPFAIQRQEQTYQFEWAIPWAVLGGRPRPEQSFRFSLALHDRDRDGQMAKLHWSVDQQSDPGRLLFGEARLSDP